MQAFGPGESFVFDGREIVRALEGPTRQAGLKTAVGDQVRAVVNAHFDFVDQTFANALEIEDEAVVDGRAERFAQRAGPLDGRPLAFAGVVAVGPV